MSAELTPPDGPTPGDQGQQVPEADPAGQTSQAPQAGHAGQTGRAGHASQAEPAAQPAPLHAAAGAPAAGPDRTPLALAVLGAALLLAGWGDLLFYEAALGLNWLLWTGACAAAWAMLARRRGWDPARDRAWLMVPFLGFAAGIAWRANPTLVGLDFTLCLLAAAMLAWRPRAGRLRETTLADAAEGTLDAGLSAMGGALGLLLDDIRWASLRQDGAWKPLIAVGWGLVIAAPILLVFGSLFAQADARFSALVQACFQWDLGRFVPQALLIGFLAWGLAGALRRVILRPAGAAVPDHGPTAAPGAVATASAPAPTRPERVRLGLIEVATVLVTLDALFAVFVWLQLPYLFGGAARVMATEGLTYADYARKGFFELSMVSVLVLPLQLALHWVLAPSPRAERVFRALAALQLALLGVVIASAVQRMWIYQSTYGLTLLRINVLAFELWMVGLIAWFAATVLRGQRARFLWGALVWGFAGAAFMHLPNWEDRIVRHNVALAKAGRTVDALYVASLSSDAVPAIVEARQGLPEGDRANMAASVLVQAKRAREAGWRGWSWSAMRAVQAVEADKKALEAEAAHATHFSSEEVRD